MAVVQRGKSWYVHLQVNGERIRQVIKEARTRREAERAERKILSELFEKRWGIGGRMNFADFVENKYKPYAEEKKEGFYVEKTVLKALIARFGKCRLVEISPEDVEQFKRDRRAEITRRGVQRSKATVNRDVAVLSSIFNLAKKFKEVKENPVNQVEYYNNLPTKDRVLSELEEKILFDYIKDDVRFSNQIEILLYTGMRRGELFKIEWRDIDLANGFINLRKEITKTKKARPLPMLSNVKAIFERLFREREEKHSDQKVYDGVKSQDIALSQRFTAVCKDLGFKDLTLHSLRHTYSTRCDESKVGAFAQKALLGHSKLSMTDRYTHPSKETLKENIVGLEQYINRRNDTKNAESPNLLSVKKSL